MYKEHLALNNLQWLICHRTKPNQTKTKNALLSSFFIIISEIIQASFNSFDTFSVFDLIKQLLQKISYPISIKFQQT